MGTINRPNPGPILQRATLSPRSAHLTGNLRQVRALLVLISGVICLWNCFQTQAQVGPQQVMALARERPNHLVQIPGVRFAATSKSLPASANSPSQGARRHEVVEIGLEQIDGRHLDNLKYVNYTSEQTSERASQNHPADTALRPNSTETTNKFSVRFTRENGGAGEPPPEQNHTNSKRSLNQSQQSQQQQFGLNNLVGPPKLVQWSKEAVNYYEGSTLVLSCSLSYSGGERGGQLKFSWFKHGKQLTSNGPNNMLLGRSDQRLSIETLADYSFLRLVDLRPSDSGAYTCVVSNSLNQEDRTTTQVIVNVKLKWLMPMSHSSGAGQSTGGDNETTLIGNGHQFERVRAGQSASFECNAAGGAGNSRGLRVRWFRLVSTSQLGAASNSLHSNQLLEHHNNRSSSHGPIAFNRHGMDETQIKKSLLQLDTIQTPTDSLNRIELVGSSQGESDFQTREKHQHSSGLLAGQLRWRIETNSGPSSSAQQNEIFSRLTLERLEPSLSGLYECEVAVGLGQSSPGDSPSDLASGNANQRPSSAAVSSDKLKRFFGLFVNGLQRSRSVTLVIKLVVIVLQAGCCSRSSCGHITK